MTTPPEQAPQEAALFRTIREWGITRGDHGVVGGVVEGLGDRIGMARVPARIIVVVALLVLKGLVLVAYAVAWALLPDRKGNIILQNFGRGIPNVGALVGIGILTLTGLGWVDNGPGITFHNIPWGDPGNWGIARVLVLIFAILVPLIVIGAIVAVVVVLLRRNGAAKGATPVANPVFAAPPANGASVAASSPAGSAATATAPAVEPPPPAPSAAAAMPPARQWAPVPPAPPVPPRRPQVPGPGRTFYLMSLAWAAIAAAAAVWMDRMGHLAVHPVIAGSVIFATGLGVIAIFVSLAGRKLGFLGFLAIASLLPLVIIAANANELRTAYADHGGITPNGGITAMVPSSPPVAFDPTLAFDPTYTNVYFDASCYQADWTDTHDSTAYVSVQRLNLAANTAAPTAPTASNAATAPTAPTASNAPTAPTDTKVAVTAELTYVTIAKGANVTLTGGINASATVVFADKGFVCDFQPGTDPYMELTNPGAPTIDLVVKDDHYANTIVIQEVAS